MFEKLEGQTVSRLRFVTSLGATALVSACAGGSDLITANGSAINRLLRPASLPPGYTTTHSVGTSSLFYNGTLLATLTTDQTTFLTTLYYAPTRTTYHMTPPTGSVTVGSTYVPTAGATITYPSSGMGKNANMTAGGGSGYYDLGNDAQGNYIGTMYHSTMIPTVQKQNYGGGTGGGGTGCGTNVCPNVSAECLLSATFAIGATIGFVGAIAAAIANPAFGMLEVGFLCLAHGFAVAEIANAVVKCTQ